MQKYIRYLLFEKLDAPDANGMWKEDEFVIYVLDNMCCTTSIRNDGIVMSLRLMN